MILSVLFHAALSTSVTFPVDLMMHAGEHHLKSGGHCDFRCSVILLFAAVHIISTFQSICFNKGRLS